MMKLVGTYWGPAFMLILGVSHLCRYGTRWELGRYGLPHSLLSSDGATYLDGSPIDPLTAHLIRRGIEEELFLGLAIVIFLLILGVAYEIRRGIRLRRELRRNLEILARLQLGD
ncbi:MAG: hypothetical protein SFV23_16830 [Planctomycetaceae bacterium]|nr:hypothetical protein [Planctomycetaceae bacterium]